MKKITSLGLALLVACAAWAADSDSVRTIHLRQDDGQVRYVSKIYQLKQEKAATEERINALNAKQAQLEEERKRLDDPKYLEKLAREDYNMVGKNEVPLFIVDEKKAAKEPQQ